MKDQTYSLPTPTVADRVAAQRFMPGLFPKDTSEVLVLGGKPTRALTAWELAGARAFMAAFPDAIVVTAQDAESASFVEALVGEEPHTDADRDLDELVDSELRRSIDARRARRSILGGLYTAAVAVISWCMRARRKAGRIGPWLRSVGNRLVHDYL